MHYLTQDLPGIGGVIRETLEDFVVEEVPMYEPCGEGAHVYCQIEKRNLTTFDAVRLVANQLRVRPHDIGYAGMKDAKAVTRQVLSVPGVTEAQAQAVSAPTLSIRWAKRHRNKLKLGHLRGNRFEIRVRNVEQSAADTAQEVLEILGRRGVPNYFGEQRFGSKGETHLPGREMVRGDIEAAVRAFLGQPSPRETVRLQEARSLFDQGRLSDAQRAFPPAFRNERRTLQALIDTHSDWPAAFRSIPRELRRLFVTAYQSHLFNQIADRRIEQLDELWQGDLAYKHVNGACFVVEDVEAERPRLEAFEISPSGPLYGHKLKFAEGKPGEIEREVLAAEGITLEAFKSRVAQSLRGARRPLRFPISDVSVGFDQGLLLSFFLPKGCYATTVLREVMKADEGTVHGGQSPASA